MRHWYAFRFMRLICLLISGLAATHLSAGWLTFHACDEVAGDGPERKETIQVGSWEKLFVEGPVDVTIVPGDSAASHAVEMAGPADVMKYFSIGHFYNALRITTRIKNCLRSRGGRLQVKLNAWRLKSIEAFDIASVKSMGRLHGNRLSLDFPRETTGDLELDYQTLVVRTVSNAKLSLAGVAKRLKANIASNYPLNAAPLIVTDCAIESTWGGSAEVTVSGTLKASVNSDGTIRYHGKPARVKVWPGLTRVRPAD